MLASHVLVKTLETIKGLAAIATVTKLDKVEFVILAIGKGFLVVAKHLS
jgi:hypothetical protein